MKWGLFVLFNGEYGLFQVFKYKKNALAWAKSHLSWKYKVERL